ncbi:MAG: tyrosine-type recombinase/integrase [Actinoallomurus sp.]
MPERAAAAARSAAALIATRYRALILLATFGNMRWGELAGLRRRNLDLEAGTVRVDETVYELGPLVKGTPKSEASKRKIAIPDLIIPDLRQHLATFAAEGPDGFVFVGVRGGQLRRSNFSKPWANALDAAGLPRGVHLHDLRHTGNTFAAEAGASLAELMSRMGHSSTRAARIYLHARQERDKEIATTLGRMAKRELKRSQRQKKPGDKPANRSGT